MFSFEKNVKYHTYCRIARRRYFAFRKIRYWILRLYYIRLQYVFPYFNSFRYISFGISEKQKLQKILRRILFEVYFFSQVYRQRGNNPRRVLVPSLLLCGRAWYATSDQARLTRALSWFCRIAETFLQLLSTIRKSNFSHVKGRLRTSTKPGSGILASIRGRGKGGGERARNGREKERTRDGREETVPTSMFRSRMEISFASFLRLIRRETEPRGRCRFADFEKGKQKGRNKGGGDAERRTRAAGAGKGENARREGGRVGATRAAGDCRGAARTGRRSVVVRITAKRHRPIFLPPARTKRQLVSLLLREYRTFNLPTAVR